MSQSNSLLLNPESTVPEETSHYDCNNLEDIAKTKQIAKQKKDTKTTISALEKQSQKLKRTHLTAQMIYLLCQRGYKFVMRKRQKKSTKTQTLEIDQIISPDNIVLLTWQQVDEERKQMKKNDSSRNEANIKRMNNFVLDEFDKLKNCSIVYGTPKKSVDASEMLFITRNVLAIHVDNHVITKEMYLEDGGIIFQTYF